MTKTSPASHIVSGLLGGLVAVVIGSILIATGAIDTGETKTVVQKQGETSRPQADASSGPTGLTVRGIYDRVGPGVAFIEAKVQQSSDTIIPGFGTPRQGTASGSGVALDKRGYVLTNAHVVEGATRVTVRFGKQDPVDAKIVGRDPSTDLAVLKVDPAKTKLAPLELGDSDRLHVGDETIAIGNPFGLENTVTTGIVSALQRSINAPNGFSIDHVIQTDASINPGNSGGPLLDGNGRVIGINAQIETGGQSNGSVGIGFAIPINTAKKVVPELERGGNIQHAYIGITTASITPQDARDLNLPVQHGALVQAVTKGSPAAKAGIHAGDTQTSAGLVVGGDLIVEVAGKQVREPQDIASAISLKRPGDKVAIKLYRGRALKTVEVTLAKRPNRVANPNDEGGGGLFPGLP